MSPSRARAGLIASAALAVLLAAGAPALSGARLKPLVIEPGPKAITEEEKAIVADPAKGIEHAVILLEEIDRDEDLTQQVSYHLRAKVLSAEGRSLADVEIPYDVGKKGAVKRWWAHVVLPDGRVLELREDQLQSQTVTAYKGTPRRHLKGALPGVEPGAIIDYGYTVSLADVAWYWSIPLERRYPVREFRIRVKPNSVFDARYLVLQEKGRDIKAEGDGSSFLIVAKNLNPVPEEPFMPPLEQTRSTLVLYYSYGPREVRAWWDELARREERAVTKFVVRGALDDLMARMALPEEPLEQKLRAAYDWFGANLQIDYLRTTEEVARQTAKEDDDDDKETLATLLEKKTGGTWQIASAFIGVARKLGAEADVVWASDRTENYWSPQILTGRQFSQALALVRLPGVAEPKLVAPCSGLKFGQVPWWLSGISAFSASKAGAGTIQVGPTLPEDSVGETVGKVSFGEDNATVKAEWTRTGAGQFGYSERRFQRRKTPQERQERNDELCGAGASFEVAEAKLEGIDDLRTPFKLQCAGEMTTAGIDDAVTRYSFGAAGPWNYGLPAISAPQRVHPVHFDYPYTDHSVIEVEAPHGFKPGTAPPPVNMNNGALSFSRVVTATPTGFRVERTFKLTTLIVRPDVYSMLVDWLKIARRADERPLEFLRVTQ